MATFTDRVKNAWNAFANEKATNPQNDPLVNLEQYSSPVSTIPQQRPRTRIAAERTILASIYARISIDVAATGIRHTRHDEVDRYKEDIDSGLNECLTVNPNLDQGPRQFRQDIAMTLFDKGVAAIVPVDTVMNPLLTGGFDVRSLRVGDIVRWYPKHVRVSVYNENSGNREEVTLPKTLVAIVENPLFEVMNKPISTLQRLQRKLGLLDTVDDSASSGKLDMIIQLPYVIKSDARRQQAEQRRQDIEFQLKGSQYGIAYTDGTEKITQLNRPVENNLLEQIQDLKAQLYVELGLTPEVMNGTANEASMLNYNARTIEPIMDAIVEAMKKTFLTKTARTQGQSIDYFRDPFKLVPVSQIAEISDKMTRNEILTSNEIRQAIGYRPSQEPKADQLINSNMPVGDTGVAPADPNAPPADPNAPTDPNAPADTSVPDAMGQSFDSIDSTLSDVFSSLGIDDSSMTQTALAHASNGPMDPGIMETAMSELMTAVDAAFAEVEKEL